MSDLISRQAAIDRLTEYGNGRAVFISVGEAIIRIEQLPPANCSEFPNNSDTISRQAALYAIYGICNEPVAWLMRVAREIEKLPSVQPEDCDTCKHGYFGDDQCERCRVRYPSHYERRTDGH